MSDEKSFPPKIEISTFQYRDGNFGIVPRFREFNTFIMQDEQYISIAESDHLRALDRAEIERLRDAPEKVRREVGMEVRRLNRQIEAKNKFMNDGLARISELEGLLNLAEDAIKALITTQKESGLGLIGSSIVGPHTIGKIREARSTSQPKEEPTCPTVWRPRLEP